MPPSLPTNDLPEGVSDADLYDGPKVVHLASGKASFLVSDPEPAGPSAAPAQTAATAAALIAPIPQAPSPQGPAQPAAPHAPPPPSVSVSPAEIKRDYAQLIELALDVISARLLGVIALLASVVFWGMVVYDPTIARIEAASAFSLLVFAPVMIIYWRAGLTGEGS